MTHDLESRFPGVAFYNAALTEVHGDVEIGEGSRVGSMTIIHAGARIGRGVLIGSHCNICASRIGSGVSIQTGCHITRGVEIGDDVFIGPGVTTLNDPLDGAPLIAPRIGAGAKIGGGALLLPGVVIGPGAFVAAGAVVARDVPAEGRVGPDRGRVAVAAGSFG